MPLQDRQKMALDALNWLYSGDPGDRRSGRSYVLAIHYLYRAADEADYGASWSEGWVKIIDHAGASTADRVLHGEILRLVCDLNLADLIDTQSGRGSDLHIRVKETPGAPAQVRHTLNTRFNSLSPELANGVGQVIRKGLDFNSPPLRQTTLWDLVREDD